MSIDPTRFQVSGTDGLPLACYRWDPSGPPRAIVQIAHGLGEHALRYAHVAHSLTAAGFVAYAHDHRGHGATVTPPSEYGVLGEGGWTALVADIGVVGSCARTDHPSVPLALIGHSMGSFAAQQYLLDHSSDVDAAVLSGTAAIDLLEPALDLDQPTELSAFNAAFQPQRTDFDWLTRDEAQVDAYVADPLCGFGLDVAGGRAMFAGARAMADPDRVAGMRADLPLYITVGEMDPVNGGLALLQPLVDRYRRAGLSDLTVRTWPGARHEVFNETNGADVVADLTEWLISRLTTASG